MTTLERLQGALSGLGLGAVEAVVRRVTIERPIADVPFLCQRKLG